MTIDVLILVVVFLLGFQAGGWAMLNYLINNRN